MNIKKIVFSGKKERVVVAQSKEKNCKIRYTLTLEYNGMVHSCTDFKTQSCIFELTLWLYCITLDINIFLASASPRRGILIKLFSFNLELISLYISLFSDTEINSFMLSGKLVGSQSKFFALYDFTWSRPSNRIISGLWRPFAVNRLGRICA